MTTNNPGLYSIWHIWGHPVNARTLSVNYTPLNLPTICETMAALVGSCLECQVWLVTKILASDWSTEACFWLVFTYVTAMGWQHVLNIYTEHTRRRIHSLLYQNLEKYLSFSSARFPLTRAHRWTCPHPASCTGSCDSWWTCRRTPWGCWPGPCTQSPPQPSSKLLQPGTPPGRMAERTRRCPPPS